MSIMNMKIPKMLTNLIQRKQLYGYINEAYGFAGIVVACSEKSARYKVESTYQRHGYGYQDDGFKRGIVIQPIEDVPFTDAPCVLETCYWE